jgi:cytochrome c oxidase cbb3-type subunit III
MQSRTRHLATLTVAALLATAAFSCKREQRSFRVPPPVAELSEDIPYNNPVRPGPTVAATPSTELPVNLARVIHEPYATQFPNNAQALSEGNQLYEAFNCVGCHAHGGGGMAPPLIDNKWFYGSEPQNVYQSIVEGRSNGMPSFRGRIPDNQVWELVAYVRSLSGQASPNAAPGREDHMSAQPPPNSMPKEKPVVVPEPTTGPTGGQVTGSVANPTTTGTEPTTQPTTTPDKQQ